MTWKQSIESYPIQQFLFIVAIILIAQLVGASGFEWETGAEKIKDSLLGPVALAIVIVANIGLVATIYFRVVDRGEGVLRVVFIIILVFGAAQWVVTLYTGTSPAGVLLGG